MSKQISVSNFQGIVRYKVKNMTKKC